MSTVVKITKSSVQKLVNDGLRGAELADALGMPKSKLKDAIKALDISIPRASKGGTIFQFVDDTLPSITSVTTAPEDEEVAF
jgi:hypothetical protein